MMTRYYEEELARLRELAADFAAAHPALAPMLGGPSADPDVERLLEGVAFQNGLLRQKLDDDFPELIHDLVRLACPQYLRPTPAATIVAFSPKPSLIQSRTIPAGSQLASVPVEGTRCLFRTCGSVELHPLELRDASFHQPAWDRSAITVSLALDGLSLGNWSPETVRFFLAGDYSAAADLSFLLRRHLKQIVLEPQEGGRCLSLPPDCLKPLEFSMQEPVIPYPSNAFPGYRLLQEYFTIPQRFLFFDLVGWDRWLDRGSGSRFTIRFELSPFTVAPPRVRRESLVLFAAPAINLFSHDANPITLDHRKAHYLVRPAGLPPHHAQVFSVDQVTGFRQGTARGRSYRAFDDFRHHSPTEPVYHAGLRESPMRDLCDLYLSFPYPAAGGGPEVETVSVALTCTNAALPQRLRIGDVCEGTAFSPEPATFRNITPVTGGMPPPLGRNLLWRLVSHLSLNRSSIASADKLRALLNLYLFEEGNPEQSAVAANRKRIDGIEEVAAVAAQRLVRGVPVRGTDSTVTVNGDNFAGIGDLFLFGSVLDSFLGGYASINTFSRLTIRDSSRDTVLQWQPRLGEQVLL